MGEEAHTLCDLGRAVAGLNKDIATLGTESSGDGSGEGVDTVQQSLSALNTELELLEAIVSLWYGTGQTQYRTLWAKRCCCRETERSFEAERAEARAREVKARCMMRQMNRNAKKLI